MLMFNFHIGFSLSLIALALGAAILVWSKAHKGIDIFLAKLIAYIVIIISILNISCNVYWATKYFSKDNLDKPYPMMMQHQGKNNMMPMNGKMKAK
jgi:hypothetical protein